MDYIARKVSFFLLLLSTRRFPSSLERFSWWVSTLQTRSFISGRRAYATLFRGTCVRHLPLAARKRRQSSTLQKSPYPRYRAKKFDRWCTKTWMKWKFYPYLRLNLFWRCFPSRRKLRRLFKLMKPCLRRLQAFLSMYSQRQFWLKKISCAFCNR